MTELLFMVEEVPEGGHFARALGESIFTEADDLDSLRLAIREAVKCHSDPGRESKVVRLQTA